MQKTKIWKVTASLLLCALLIPPGGVYADEEIYVPFDDVAYHPYMKSIFKAVEMGLFAESKDGHFYPDRNMTRAEYLALLDRLLLINQDSIEPYTFMSESYTLGREDDFSDPHLPYTDVDRLSWMYRPVLRSSLMLEKLFGPDALAEVFPGPHMQPAKPVTKGEAVRLLQGLLGLSNDTDAWNQVAQWGWLKGKETDALTRGESAVLAVRVMALIQADGLHPTLDLDGSKYPLVPEIIDMFPLFGTYTSLRTAEDQAFIDAASAVQNREDNEQTYASLEKLIKNNYYNKIGAYYYLSWDPLTSLDQNMEQAYAAIDAYFADRVVLPETIRLLTANVYDIALQQEASDDKIYEKTLARLKTYEAKMKVGSAEWKAFSIYLAAMEARTGDVAAAMKRYEAIGDTSESLRNLIHYLLTTKGPAAAQTYLQSMEKSLSSNKLIILQQALQRDLAELNNQDDIVTDLTYTLNRFEMQPDYQIEGTAVLTGYRFKYNQMIDQDAKISHTTGYYQAPIKMVLQKMESYTDHEAELEYYRDYDSQTWKKNRIDEPEYVYQWIEAQSVRTRKNELKARYSLQTFGRYDVITEWIPGEAIVQKAHELRLDAGRMRSAPVYMNKYYIDRTEDQLVAHQWHYEEIYESQKYVSYTGNESYTANQSFSIAIPGEVREGGK